MTFSILSFLAISFGYSLFEKLKDKKGYTQFLIQHLKTEQLGNLFWWLLVFMNTITVVFILISICSLFLTILPISIILTYKICSANILILLIGQRIAVDFQGAANLGIYFIITLFGWYLQNL